MGLGMGISILEGIKYPSPDRYSILS